MSRDSFIQAAFDAVCKDAKQPEGCYVVLMSEQRVYLGPEEGGCWGSDYIVEAYQQYTTREAAEAAKASVEKLAEELSQDAMKSHGERCLREMDWLDERGLEADWLPESDGPSTFYVVVTDELPQDELARRGHYE